MKKVLVFLVTTAIFFSSQVALADKSIDKKVLDYVVTLVAPNGQEYCSGVIMKGVDRGSYLVSAAHCFGIALYYGFSVQYKMGDTIYDAGECTADDMAIQNDVAAIKTPVRHNTPLVATPNWEELQTVMMITKFPKYVSDPELSVQLMTIMGVFEEDFTLNYTNGDLRSGMSGSPVFDSKMRVVGLATQTVRAVKPVGFLTMLTNTVFPDRKDRFAWSKSKKIEDRRMRIPEER